MKYLITIVLFLHSISAAMADELPVIPLHIAIISDRAEVTSAWTDENIAWIQQNLNEEFKAGDGTPLARFEIKARTNIDEAREQAGLIWSIEDQKVLHSNIRQAIRTPLFKPDMVNIFVFFNSKGKSNSNGGNYCAHRTRAGEKTSDCYAWVLLDWQALEKHNSRILVHETGHVFSLKHVLPVNNDKRSKENNVMAADKNPAPVALPEGESGYYFTPSQVETLKGKMQMLLKTFNRAAAGEPLIGR